MVQSPLEERREEFDMEDFEVVQTLGYLSVKVSKPREMMVEEMKGGMMAKQAAVIAFAARYFSGKPYRYPVLTLLKEFLPEARSVAENEFRALTHLTEIPEDKWQAANSTERTVPVVQLLGYFRGARVDEGQEMEISSDQQSLWFVYKWEGMKPLSAYFTAEQKPPSVLWPWAKSKRAEIEARHKMIRSIFRGIMEAVRWCHEKGVVHGSLGSGSVLLSTFDDYSADSLYVKLDNFGFAAVFPSKQEDLSGSQLPDPAPEDDFRAVGLLFLETVILSLTETNDPATQVFIERLTFEIFRNDFIGLKEYCSNEPNWSQAVSFLNEREGAGWKLLQKLLEGELSPASSLERRFLD